MMGNSEFRIDRKKILLVSHEMTYTGAPKSLLKLACILQKCAYEVEIWTLKDGNYISEFEKNSFSVTTIDFPENASERLSKNLKRFDLVIANTIFCAQFARFSQMFTRTILYIREAANISNLINGCFLNAEDISKCNHIICVSEYAKKYVQKYVKEDSLTIIENFVFDKRKKNRHINLSKKFHILVSGTIEPRKGQLLVLKAIDALPYNIKQRVLLHLVGNTTEWASEYYKKLEIEKREDIIYHGVLTDTKKLYDLYNKMNLIVVPSYDESCSLVALENAMLGNLILLTENTGAKYIVDNDCVFETGNYLELSSKIQEIILHPELKKAYGEKNRKRYLKFATPEIYKQKILTYLKKIENEIIISEDKKIKVSIIVPVYNVENYLEICLESLINQTLKDIEIICVNDGSTDSSLEILKRYREKDSRILIIDGINHGYGYAMNLGIKRAKGHYIGIVEPDDYIDCRMYEILYYRAMMTDCDIIKCDFYRFFGENENQIDVYNKIAIEGKYYNRIINPLKEKEIFRFQMNTWTGIYKKEFIVENKILHNETPGASYQDNGFWFQGFCFAQKVYFVNKALYYNRRDNPNSSIKSKEKVFDINNEYRFIRDFLNKNKNIEKKFLFQYSLKKYQSYMFTLDRIDFKYKLDYLKNISNELKSDEENHELCQAVFTPPEWSNINWIINDYMGYYQKKIENKIKISIVIPIYNAQLYLYQCLESIERQTFREFEVICINDGSTDKSREIIEKFVNRDNRFILINQENKGAGESRNIGLQLAKGEYILFLDSDDYFKTDMLFKIFNKIRETDADICVMGSWQYDQISNKVNPCIYAINFEALPKYRPFSITDVNGNPFRCFMGWAWDKLYSRQFLLNNNLKFQHLRTTNDMYFTYMSLYKAEKITVLEDRLVYQRRNVKDSLSSTRDKSFDCFLFALDKMKSELINMGLFEKNKIYFQNYAVHSCLWNLMTLSESVAEVLLQELTQYWFAEFEIEKLSQNQFEYLSEYKEYKKLFVQGGLRDCRKEYSSQKENINSEEILSDFNNDNDYYKYCLDEIRKSKSYKIGLAITWLPRKIRGH